MAVIAVKNVEFKKGYSKYIRNAFFGALVVHFLIFYFSPPFEFKPYVLREEYFEAIDLPEQFDIPPPPKEIEQPAVPIEAAEGEEVDEEAEIAPTSFDRIEDVPPPPADGGEPLNALDVGERGVVVGMDGGRGLLCRMTSLGFTPGAEVTVMQNYGHGPLICRVRNARIALGRGEAGRIYVRRGRA